MYFVVFQLSDIVLRNETLRSTLPPSRRYLRALRGQVETIGGLTKWNVLPGAGKYSPLSYQELEQGDFGKPNPRSPATVF